MAVQWISKQEAEKVGPREERVLLEQTPGHYPEFEDFLGKELEKKGGRLFFRGVSGAVYSVGWLPEGDPDELRGIEVTIRTATGSSMPSMETIDLDLWPFLEWLIEGTGGEWTLKALRQTGAIYRVPGAPERA